MVRAIRSVNQTRQEMRLPADSGPLLAITPRRVGKHGSRRAFLRPCAAKSSLLELDLERLASNEPFEGGDPRLVFRDQLILDSVVVERAAFILLGPDRDQRALYIVFPAERAHRLAFEICLDARALPRCAVAAASLCHGVLLAKTPALSNRGAELSSFRGALQRCPSFAPPFSLLARVGRPVAAVHADKACDSVDSHAVIPARGR